MGAQNLVGMLDRTEIGFGARQNFAHVAHQPVAVFTVEAVEFLDEIEVLQLGPVIHQVVAAAHLGDAVNRKAAPLVKTHAQVQQHQRKNHAVDDGAGDQVLRPIGHQPAEEVLL